MIAGFWERQLLFCLEGCRIGGRSQSCDARTAPLGAPPSWARFWAGILVSDYNSIVNVVFVIFFTVSRGTFWLVNISFILYMILGSKA